MRLIAEWRRAWRWFSVQAMALAAALQAAWAALPDDMKQRMPETLVAFVTVTLLVLGIGGRLVSQARR